MCSAAVPFLSFFLKGEIMAQCRLFFNFSLQYAPNQTYPLFYAVKIFTPYFWFQLPGSIEVNNKYGICGFVHFAMFYGNAFAFLTSQVYTFELLGPLQGE